MSTKTPKNINFLSPNGFELVIQKLPHIEWFVQDVEIPGVDAPEVIQPNPLVPIKQQADQMNFSPLSISLAHDEEMKCWEELFKWKLGIAFPNESKEHADLKKGSTLPPNGLFSDLSIIVATSHHNPNLIFTFKDAFPISISSLSLTSKNTDVPTLNFTVSFSYTSFSFDRLK